MSQDITLDQLTPRMTFKGKVALGGLVLIIFTVLVSSYVWTGIDPFALWNKRGNAFQYLFGRQLSEVEQQEAMRQAERLPDIILQQEVMAELRGSYEAEGRTPPETMTLMRQAEKIVAERLQANPGSREEIVRQEYERLLDEKRGGYFPPEVGPKRLLVYTKALVETVAIAIWGTLLAFVAAIPVSMFAARNTLRLMVSGNDPAARGVRWFSHFVVRRVLDFCRGFNEFVMALIFVAVIGLGPFAGVMALAIHTFGILGKVFSEAIEAIEPGQVEAVEASGAGPAQIMAFSVLPQIMPLVVSYSLLRFESNVRSATILGFVGAGGIGFLMFDKINGYLYREVCTMMIMVIACVTVIDYLCGLLRKQFT